MSYWHGGKFSTTRLAGVSLAMAFAALLGCGGGQSNSDSVAKQFRPVPDASATKTKPVTSEAANKAELALAPGENNAAVVTPPPTPPAALEQPVGEATPGEKGLQVKLSPEIAAKVKQMRDLEDVKPRGTTQEQQYQFLLNAINTRLTLAEGLASDPAAPEIVREEALMVRMSCYAMLIDADQPEAREKFAQAAKELSEVANPKLAIVGKTQLFSLKVMEIFALQPRDGKAVVASIANLLEEIGQAEIGFEATVRVVQLLERQQFAEDAVAAMNLIGNHYASSSNPQLALQARSLQMSSLVVSLQKAEGQEADKIGGQLVEKLQEIVKLSKGDPSAMELALNVARILEGQGNGERSLPVYELVQNTFGKDPNEKLAAETSEAVQNAQRRIGLVGKSFEVTGLLQDGAAFDWAPYRGKVVLVDFWATWCGPCLAEMSNIRRNYNKYHEQGFEVVGVNLDESPEELAAFFEKQKLPWATVTSADPKQVGFRTPIAQACGVDAIPFVILIGRDGKVLGIHVRGERLETQLAELFNTTPNTEKESEIK